MGFARFCWIPRVRTMIRTRLQSVWMRATAHLGVVLLLLCLGIANIAQRVAWNEVDDGVLWRAAAGDVVAAEVAPGSGAARAGVHAGDVLLAINGRPVDQIQDVVAAQHASHDGQTLHYTLLRMRTQQIVDVAVAPIPSS